MSLALSRARPAVALVAAVVAATLAGCTGPPMPTPTTAAPSPTGDGILRIGTLFPASGALAAFSPGQVAAVNAAVREINAAGGVLGVPVEVVSRDAGADDSGKAGPSFDDLVARGVDVVIGPSSSVVVESLLPAAAVASVPIVSPSATASGLTGADGGGWFFRTVPTDADEGAALADRLVAGGASTVVLVGTGGRPGPASSEALAAGLTAQDADLLAEVPGDGDPVAVAEQVVGAGPDAVVLATANGGKATVALIAALGAAGFGGERLWLLGPNVVRYGDVLPDGALTGVQGIKTGARADEAMRARTLLEDPGAGLRYAPEAYDATILVALAATLAGDDGGASIARMLPSASVGGIPCASYGECLDVMTTQTDIDYRGASGSLDLDENGDLTEPGFALYGYSPENALIFAEWVVG